MGQKASPKDLRIGKIFTWDSRWFNIKNYPKFLKEDYQIREFLEKKLKEAALDRVLIERSGNNLTVIVLSAKPGFIIGRQGSGIEDLKNEILKKFFENKNINFNLNVQEVSKPGLSAAIVAKSMAAEIEKRTPFRRVMKQALERVEKAGAKGVKVSIAGRLNGSEIARTETLAVGKIPLHTFRADIDYSLAEAHTTYGLIGIKVWIYKGEIFEKEKNNIAKQ